MVSWVFNNLMSSKVMNTDFKTKNLKNFTHSTISFVTQSTLYTFTQTEYQKQSSQNFKKSFKII